MCDVLGRVTLEMARLIKEDVVPSESTNGAGMRPIRTIFDEENDVVHLVETVSLTPTARWRKSAHFSTCLLKTVNLPQVLRFRTVELEY